MKSNGGSLSGSTSRGSARDEILGRVKSSLGPDRQPLTDHPHWKTPARKPGSPQVELAKLFAEITGLGGSALQLKSAGELQSALERLVSAQNIRQAALWENQFLVDLQVGKMLGELGVEIVSPHAGRLQLAGCALGVTGVDCALPETGTLVLCSAREQPLAVSLLPRVHLAILDLSALRLDLSQALEELRGRRLVCITGPSRTADIEMTLAIGVHGPGVLAVWALDENFSQG